MMTTTTPDDDLAQLLATLKLKRIPAVIER
jgi:hypothetical protein